MFELFYVIGWFSIGLMIVLDHWANSNQKKD